MQPERLVQHTSYDDLIAVTHLMRDFPAPWFVSGGWAIDAFLGCATREHEDLEIGIGRADQGYLQLLYKSRRHSPKDEHDLRMVADRMSPDQHSWLKRALEVYRPDDVWLHELVRCE